MSKAKHQGGGGGELPIETDFRLKQERTFEPKKIVPIERAEIAFIEPPGPDEAEIPEQKQHFELPVRFGAVPVDKAPLGWEIETRRAEVKPTKFQHAYPTIRLPFQEVQRVEFGHNKEFLAANEKDPKLHELFPTGANRLFFGDNLHIMRQLPSNSIDLFYIDPPFFSGRNYNVTPAAEYDNTLFTLKQISKFRLDTTATPDRADGKAPDTKMILEYGITDAQAEVPPIIKSVVVYQPKLASVELTYTNTETGEKRTVDEMDEEFERIEKGLSSTQWVTDPDPMRKQMQIAIQRLKEQQQRAEWLGKGTYKPIVFVVAITIKDAEQARDMLKELGLKTLLVTEQSDEDDRQAARLLGKPGSEYEAVVSVLMLREGWDVPPVSVILLLRKFSSRVYGQQVVGRGLRLNMRGEDAQEICAVVDHEKLKHGWLWDMVGAKVHRDVDQFTMFGDEDLPPKRKQQVVAHPELLIEIPKPVEDEKADFDEDLDNIVIEIGDYPNWQSILDGFNYAVETEITKVEIASVEARTLDGSGFKELHEPPTPYCVGKAPVETDNAIELGESLKNSVRDIASNLLAEEGVGSHELGYLYGVLMDHVSKRMLGGKTLGAAAIEELRHALNRRHRMAANFKNTPGLVSSIVKYKKEAQYANQ